MFKSGMGDKILDEIVWFCVTLNSAMLFEKLNFNADAAALATDDCLFLILGFINIEINGDFLFMFKDKMVDCILLFSSTSNGFVNKQVPPNFPKITLEGVKNVNLRWSIVSSGLYTVPLAALLTSATFELKYF